MRLIGIHASVTKSDLRDSLYQKRNRANLQNFHSEGQPADLRHDGVVITALQVALTQMLYFSTSGVLLCSRLMKKSGIAVLICSFASGKYRFLSRTWLIRSPSPDLAYAGASYSHTQELRTRIRRSFVHWMSNCNTAFLWDETHML
ncbi:hypothetical protein Vadar_017848 [Vaccinium darrowii]|uniref:Uncharacterized protein n=1 Tax=Vaccinium darrowii TaxID=229202 RepID=A0ACB7Z5E4_9ERIC|nr:hypothetical protein Vadar_017848 [Vaccinium darrowii]